MKTKKHLLALALCCAMLLGTSTPFASAASSDPINIGTYSDWSQLRSTSNSFDISDDGMASMIARTNGFSSSTKVTVAIYLERLQNGNWSTVSGMSWSDSTTSTFTISISKSRSVTSGYYYRLRSEHSATGPNGTETDTIYSSSYYYGK